MKPRTASMLLSLLSIALLAMASGRARPCVVPSDLAAALPPDTLLYAEARGGAALWKDFHATLWPRILASPIEAGLRTNAGYLGWIAGQAAFALAAGHSAEDALLNALGDEAVLGVIPRAGSAKPESILLMRARDPALARRGATALAALMKRPLPASADGAPLILPLDQGACLALLQDLVIIASDQDALEHLEQRLRAPDPGLAAKASFARARTARAPGAFLFAWADTAALAALTPGPGLVPERSDNPLAQLLIGRVLAALNAGESVSADVTRSGRELELALHVPHAATDASRLAAVFGGAPKMAAPIVPHTLLSLSARRDFHGWWEAREELLEARLAPGLVELETNMGVFFGRAFTDVLQGLDGDAHFLLVRQEFAERAPTVRYPAGALIVKLADARTMWPQVQMAFQTAISFVNVDRGQKGEVQLLIDGGTYREQPIMTTRYLAEMRAGSPSPEYENVRPACAVAGGELVLASSVDLARQAVDAILDGRRAAPDDALDALVVQAKPLWKLLVEDEAPLVAQNMLEKGHDKAAAKQELDVLVALVQLFEDARLATREAGGTLTVSARVRLAPSELAVR